MSQRRRPSFGQLPRKAKNAVWDFYGMDHLKKTPRERRPHDGPSEHQVQAGVIQWWSLFSRAREIPEFFLYAIPNGGARDAITGARLKAEGVRPGIPDLFLAVPVGAWHGLYLEVKRDDGRESASQVEVREALTAAGYACAVAYSIDEGTRAIEGYLDGRHAGNDQEHAAGA